MEERRLQFNRFLVMGRSKEVDLHTYARQVLKDEPDCEVHIGSDSQNLGERTTYVTTVVFRFPGRGAHVVYCRERIPVIRDMWTKLWGELERSIELADFFKDELGIKVTQIDLDYNTDPQYPSNKVLNAASGYVQSLGYNAKAKPDLLMAVWAANVLCH